MVQRWIVAWTPARDKDASPHRSLLQSMGKHLKRRSFLLMRKLRPSHAVLMRHLTSSGKKSQPRGRFHNGRQVYGNLAGDEEMSEKKAHENLTRG